MVTNNSQSERLKIARFISHSPCTVCVGICVSIISIFSLMDHAVGAICRNPSPDWRSSKFSLNLSSHSFGSQKSKIGLPELKSGQQGCVPSWGFRKTLSLPFSGFQSQPAFLGSQPLFRVFKVSSLASSNLPLTFSFVSIFHFKGPLWLHWAHLDNPGESAYFIVNWLTILFLFATLIPPCHVTLHINSFWGSGCGYP